LLTPTAADVAPTGSAKRRRGGNPVSEYKLEKRPIPVSSWDGRFRVGAIPTIASMSSLLPT